MTVKKVYTNYKDVSTLKGERNHIHIDELRSLISECNFSDFDDRNRESQEEWLEKCKNHIDIFCENNPDKDGSSYIFTWMYILKQHEFSSKRTPVNGLKDFLEIVEGMIQMYENNISLAEKNILASQDQPFYIKSERNWLYQDSVYEVTGEYSTDEKMLLVLEFVDKERRKFEQLKNKFSGKKSEELKYERNRIPEEVRIAVWRRDQGKCASCGSRENLEYDHIVPVSRGGGNTARNIELLCQSCNRSKSNRIE